ncbi:hypothetical protein [Nostoc flagelliforme]|uniref:hypothetical protein n=1 Tax=Nostoc flagelliforme TaxID=1306274 RepID=UPI0012FE65D5
MRKLNFHLYGNDNHLEWGKGSRRLPVKEPNFPLISLKERCLRRAAPSFLELTIALLDSLNSRS